MEISELPHLERNTSMRSVGWVHVLVMGPSPKMEKVVLVLDE